MPILIPIACRAIVIIIGCYMVYSEWDIFLVSSYLNIVQGHPLSSYNYYAMEMQTLTPVCQPMWNSHVIGVQTNEIEVNTTGRYSCTDPHMHLPTKLPGHNIQMYKGSLRYIKISWLYITQVLQLNSYCGPIDDEYTPSYRSRCSHGDAILIQDCKTLW